MIYVRKKVLRKNLFDIILFTLNIVGVIVSCELFYFFYRLKMNGKTEEIGNIMAQDMDLQGFKNTYKTTVTLFIICSMVVTAVFLYLLCKLFQSMSESRNIDIGIRYILGYRKIRVIKNELGYGLLRMIIADVLAIPISIAVFKVLKNIDGVKAIIRKADVEMYSVEVCLISSIVIILITIINIMVKVYKEYHM